MRAFLHLVLRLKLLVIAVAIAVVAGGAYAATELRQQLFPDIDFPFAMVEIQAPGVPPSVLDEQVAQPIARKVEKVDGLRNLTTVTSDGSVHLYGELDLGTDVDDTTKEVLDAARSVEVPAGVGAPTQMGSFTEQPVLITAILTKEDTDLGKLTKRVESLKADLLDVDGVAKVEIPGAQREQVQVVLKPEALAAGVTPSWVLDALGTGADDKDVADLEATALPETLSVPTGRTPGAAADTALEGQTMSWSTVGDVATVTKAVDPDAGFAIANGRPSIAVRIQRKQDANEVAVVDSSQKVLDRFDDANDDLELVTLSENASGVKASIKGLLIEGALGAFGAVMVIFLFLRSGRGTLIAAVSIPTSLVFGLLVGYWLDLTLDIFTLAGLTIAIGRVIDDAIVVIENISKHIERGESVRDSVVEGTAEVATAIMASTAATVAVFLPLGFLGGFISTLFRSFSIIVAVSLAASLLVAITIIPVLAELMFRKAAREHSMHVHERGRLERWVRPATAFGLRQRALTIGIAFAGLFATIGLAASGAIPVQFLPDSSLQQIYGSVTLPPGLTEEQAREQLEPLAEVLDVDGVTEWQYSYGTTPIFGAEPGGNGGAISFVANLEEEVDGGPVVKAIRKAGTAAYPDAFQVQQLENGPPAGTFQANVKADDADELREATDRLVEFLKDRKDLTEVSGSQGAATIPQLSVAPKQGVDIELAAIRRAVSAYSTPAIDATGEGASIAVLPPAPAPSGTGRESEGDALPGGDQPAGPDAGAGGPAMPDLEALALLPAVPLGEEGGASGSGQTIGEVADLSVKEQLAFVARADGKLVTTIDARIEDSDTAGVTAKIQDDIKQLQKDGKLGKATVDFEGEAAFVEQMFTDLFKAFGIAVVLVILVLILAFRHVLQPLSMLAPVLFSTFGAYLALALTRNALGLPAMIGQLLLIGIVVSNAILLVDAVIKRRRAGETAHEALREAAVQRVRPVLMTAFATMAALTPLAIGVSGEGGIISKSLGVVVIGGLALATFGTLVIVPAAYSVIARGKREERRRSAIDGPPPGGDGDDLPPTDDVDAGMATSAAT